jgi:hypothetical protein
MSRENVVERFSGEVDNIEWGVGAVIGGGVRIDPGLGIISFSMEVRYRGAAVDRNAAVGIVG